MSDGSANQGPQTPIEEALYLKQFAQHQQKLDELFDQAEHAEEADKRLSAVRSLALACESAGEMVSAGSGLGYLYCEKEQDAGVLQEMRFAVLSLSGKVASLGLGSTNEQKTALFPLVSYMTDNRDEKAVIFGGVREENRYDGP